MFTCLLPDLSIRTIYSDVRPSPRPPPPPDQPTVTVADVDTRRTFEPLKGLDEERVEAGIRERESPPVKFNRSRKTSRQMTSVFFARLGLVASVPLQESGTEWYSDVCLLACLEEKQLQGV